MPIVKDGNWCQYQEEIQNMLVSLYKGGIVKLIRFGWKNLCQLKWAQLLCIANAFKLWIFSSTIIILFPSSFITSAINNVFEYNLYRYVPKKIKRYRKCRFLCHLKGLLDSINNHDVRHQPWFINLARLEMQARTLQPTLIWKFNYIYFSSLSV